MNRKEKDELLMELQKERIKQQGIAEYKAQLFKKIKDWVIMLAAFGGLVLGVINFIRG